MAHTAPSLADVRRFALSRTFFRPTTLPRALARLGFVQADPIRAPARAQDLTLRHRVVGYRAGELERKYPSLRIEEDFFVNAGFVTRELHQLMHPRTPRQPWTKAQWRKANAVLDEVRARGVAHPRDVDEALGLGKASNWFGGRSNVSTQLLDGLHYRGLLRVARRAGGVRLYAVRKQTEPPADPLAAHDALIDAVVNTYAPLPAATLSKLVSHLRGGVPQWSHLRAAALARAKKRIPSQRVGGVDWYLPDGERLGGPVEDVVRLLAPFDPLVWDRQRFEILFGWTYRFEAYTPASKRKLGYYALPLLWRDEVVGWANATNDDGVLDVQPGFVAGKPPAGATFRRAFEQELDRLGTFLGAKAEGRTR
ncbi:MAG: crosslink repair DNA glycosylase YcaQ family protein [Myxococcaceae bacterium]